MSEAETRAEHVHRALAEAAWGGGGRSPNPSRVSDYARTNRRPRAAGQGVIACMLISLWRGRKPTLRTHEMICWYFCGIADEEELLTHLARLKKPSEPRKSII